MMLTKQFTIALLSVTVHAVHVKDNTHRTFPPVNVYESDITSSAAVQCLVLYVHSALTAAHISHCTDLMLSSNYVGRVSYWKISEQVILVFGSKNE